MTRHRYIRAVLLAGMTLFVFRPMSATPRYAIWVATTQVTPDGGSRGWASEFRFFNTGTSLANVTVLHASNGVVLAAPAPLTVAPGEMQIGPISGWFPPIASGASEFFLLKLDVPDGVTVASRIYWVLAPPCNEIPCVTPPTLAGAVDLPTITVLHPAGELQVIPSADLGSLSRRVNVTLYNAAAVPAVGTVTVKRACDNSIAGTFCVTVPADTLLQSHVPDEFLATPCAGTYLTVVMDQPGFAVAATLANQGDFSIPFGVSGASSP